jgi:hypothetical protein
MIFKKKLTLRGELNQITKEVNQITKKYFSGMLRRIIEQAVNGCKKSQKLLKERYQVDVNHNSDVDLVYKVLYKRSSGINIF